MIETLRVFINRWVILGAVLLGCGLSGALIWAIQRSHSEAPQAIGPTLVFTNVAAPTATIPGIVRPTNAPETPTSPPPTLPSGSEQIPQGATVQIQGTGTDGLNLRASPGMNQPVNYLGFEAEVFIVRDGPTFADGLNWYYLVGFYDNNRNGWAAANYLQMIQSP